VPGAEPIPGYRVVERLGSGGYGEVWKVTAPGDVPKALKIVFGGLGLHAEQEQKSLERIKSVRHPFLLSLERFEVLENQLLIITELADKSLLDRYLECHAAGQAGIPRDELLGYMRDAAEALDYMSATHDLQHQDVKPQNLLLLAGRVKVADFGLVKELAGTRVTATGGATPVYAPPEAYDGWISRHSDQYSLAIVFQEMLTGVRPFPGTTALQLARQHTSARPLLDPLPAYDRPVVARALAKVPDQRFPSCRDFAAALIAAPTAPPPAARPVAPAPAFTPVVIDEPTKGGLDLGQKTLRMEGERRAQKTPEPEEGSARAEAGGTRPMLVLGVGGLAGAVLLRLGRLRAERADSRAALPTFRLLFLDSDPAKMRRVRQPPGGGEGLGMEETLLTPLYAPEHYRSRARGLLRWLDRRWLYGIPRSLLTEGLRPLGRLALVDNAPSVLEKLREALAQVSGGQARDAAVAATGLTLRDEAPRVFVVASISGGTGGGMLLGLAYAVRQVLTDLHLSPDGICGILLHATSKKPAEQVLARANAQATLREIAHFSRPDATYPGDTNEGLSAARIGTHPFSDCYVVHVGDGLSADDAQAAAADNVAEYLHMDADVGGAFLDRFRQDSHPPPDSTPLAPPVRGFGFHRTGFPRQSLVAAAASRLCHQLVELWPGPNDDTVRTWGVETARGWLAELYVDEESLVSRCWEAAAAVFGESPESYFRRMLAQPEGALDPAASEMTRLLEHVDTLIGAGPASPGRDDAAPTAAETALQGRARVLGGELAGGLVDGLISLVETPGGRLAAGEAATSWLTEKVRSLVEGMRARLMTQVRPHRQALRGRLVAGKGGSPKGSFRLLRIALWNTDAADPDRQILEYCWVRLAELALANALEVLAVIQKQLAQFTRELATARQVLGKWVQALRPAGKKAAVSTEHEPPRPSRELLPGKAANLDEAAAVLCGKLGPEVLPELDERFQAEVLSGHGGLWRLLLEPRSEQSNPPAERIWAEMEKRAGALVSSALEDVSAARLFLDLYPRPEQAEQALAAQLKSATPKPQTSGGWQRLVVGLPGGSAGDKVKEMIEKTAAGVSITVIPTQDDLLLCFEVANVPLVQAAVAVGGSDVPDELKDQVLSRTDVAWAPLMPGAVAVSPGAPTVRAAEAPRSAR
jgi:hypothetical protein